MHIFSKSKILKIVLLSTILVAFLSPNLKLIVYAETPQERLEALQREIEKIKNQRNDLQSRLNNNTYLINGYNSEVSKLQGEVAVFQKDIDQLALEIQSLETQIQILDTQIEEKQVEIKRSEDTIVDLDRESSLRIKNSYMNYRMYGSVDGSNQLLVMDDINSYFKDSQYKEIIQSGTNELMIKVAQLRNELNEKKKQLDTALNQVKKDKEIVDIKKSDLDKKKEDIQVKLATYYDQVNRLQIANSQSQNDIASLNDSEMKLSAKAELIKQEIMVSAVSSGQYVLAGTIIGFQGCTGYCFGEHLHFSTYYNGVAVNPCGQIKPGVGCGSDGNPLQPPLRGSVSYNSGFGWRSFDNAFHDGIDITGFPLGAPVYAAHDGYVTRGLDCYHRNLGYTSTCANYVRISQTNGSNSGYVTGYWHLRG